MKILWIIAIALTGGWMAGVAFFAWALVWTKKDVSPYLDGALPHMFFPAFPALSVLSHAILSSLILLLVILAARLKWTPGNH